MCFVNLLLVYYNMNCKKGFFLEQLCHVLCDSEADGEGDGRLLTVNTATIKVGKVSST